MELEEAVKECTQTAVLISKRMPKGKCVYVPKIVRSKLNLKDGQHVYLIINGLIHPAVFCKTVITIPNILRNLVKNNHTNKVFITKINEGELLFLSRFRPVMWNKTLAYCSLQTHQLIKKNTPLELFCKNGFFYGSSCRQRISFSARTLKRLSLEQRMTYQFLARTNNKPMNNKHLFENSFGLNLSGCIKNNCISVPALLPDFEVKDSHTKIEVNYETRCKDSKRIKINKFISLSPLLLIALGMYQAEGTKTNQNYICFTNNNPDQIKFFKETIAKYFGLSNSLWRIDVATSKNNKKTKNFWCDKLSLKHSSISVHYDKNKKSEYGTANLRIINTTTRKILYRILDLIKQQVLLDKKNCGFFISGILVGDGYLQTENNKVKRIELYFNPHKPEEEFFLYQKCLSVLGVKYYYVRLPYPKGNLLLEERAEQIVSKLKEKFNNVKLQPKAGRIRGIGGVIIIHRKEDLTRLYPYAVFYPNKKHYERFYKHFELENDNKTKRVVW